MTRHETAQQRFERYKALRKEYKQLQKRLWKTTDELEQYKIRDEMNAAKADADALRMTSDSRFPFPSWDLLDLFDEDLPNEQ